MLRLVLQQLLLLRLSWLMWSSELLRLMLRLLLRLLELLHLLLWCWSSCPPRWPATMSCVR